ncbi:MAG: YceI family protein [Planctomycetales bacterium]
MPAIRPLLPVLSIPLACLFIAGCSKAPGDGFPAAQAAGAATARKTDDAAAGESGTVALSPENARIEFIGTHVKGEPNPRRGVFQKFSGTAKVDEAAKSLKAVSVEIQTDSLSTSIEKLDNHLKNEDFFDVREHPTARFESTSIRQAEDKTGEYVVTGNLSLLAATKEISFPAKISFDDGGLKLTGGLTIDRTEFGMERLQDSVHKEVEINVRIGQTTAADP